MKTESGPEIECMDCGKKRIAVPGEPLEMGMPTCDPPRCYGVMFPTGKISTAKAKKEKP